MPSTRNPATVVNPGPGLIPVGVVTSSSIIGGGSGGGSEADLLAHINDPVGAHAASAISVVDTSLTATALSSILVKSGGVGNPLADDQTALVNIDSRLTKLRAFSSTVSDNTISFGGDYNNAVLDTLVDGSSVSPLNGLISVRPGSYKITNGQAWGARSHMMAAGTQATVVYADSTRTSNVVLFSGGGGQRLENIGLGTLSTTYRHEVQGDFYLDLSTSMNGVEAGSLLLNGFGSAPSPRIVLKGIVATGNATITTATSCLEITNDGIVDISDCEYGVSALPSASTITSILNIHDYTNAFYGSINVRNCQFYNNGTVTGVSGLLMSDVRAPVRFTDCRFHLFGATGDSWSFKATDCHSIVFENCIFSNDEGQIIRCVNSGVTFIDCQFLSSTGASLANPQLICGEGYVNGTDESHKLRFVNCVATFGSANVKPTGAPTKPIIELGGRDGAAHHGPVEVDGLYIQPTGSGLGVHNFTSVVLRDQGSNQAVNTYANVTINMRGSVPTNSGTLSQSTDFPGGYGGHVVELFAQHPNGIVATNLKVVGVGTPAITVPRCVVCALLADINGLQIDGSGPGAGTYGPLIQAIDTNVTDLFLWPNLTEVICDDALRISQGFLPVKFTNCFVMLTQTTSNSWALNIENSIALTFENCDFFNGSGQALRNVNSGATFTDCRFTSGKDTTLTNPQLVCGEGYVPTGDSRFSTESGGSVSAGKWHDAAPPSGSFITAGVLPGDWLQVGRNPAIPGPSPASGQYLIVIVAANDLTVTRFIPPDAGPTDYQVFAPGVNSGSVPITALSLESIQFRLHRCVAAFGASNIRSQTQNLSLGAPIVELGGHAVFGTGQPAATALPGGVEVDGLVIKPTSELTDEDGSGVSVTNWDGLEVTLDGLSGMTAGHVGTYLRLTGAVNATNNGTFLITTFVSATSVKIQNFYGVSPDAGPITWEGILGVHNFSVAVLHDDTAFALNNAGGPQPGPRSPNKYANVTVDMLGTIPNNLGGALASSCYNYGNTGLGGPKILQISGAWRNSNADAGAAASVASNDGTKSTITGLTGITPLHVGSQIRMDKAGDGSNSGTFVITDFISGTSVQIFNINGVANSPFTWRIIGYAAPKVKAENIRVVNVGWPRGTGAATTTRGIFEATYADVDGLVVDAVRFDPIESTTASLSDSLIKFTNSDVRDVQIFPSGGILSINGTAKVMRLVESSRVSGVRYHNRGVTDDTTSFTGTLQTASGPLFSVGVDCSLEKVLAIVDQDMDFSVVTAGFVVMAGNRGRLSDSWFGMARFIAGKCSILTGGSTLMVASGIAVKEITVSNNTFRWNGTTADNLADFFTATNGVIIGNRLLSTSATAPLPVITSGTGIDLNTEGANADTTNPFVY